MSVSRPLKGNGAEGIRTPDPHNAIVVLYQLSYDPIRSGRESMEQRRVCQNETARSWRRGRMTEFFISLFPSFALCGNPQTDRGTEANKENEEDAARQIPRLKSSRACRIGLSKILRGVTVIASGS